MTVRVFASLLAALLLSVGCYHAKIETASAPSGQTFADNWARGWAWGLAGPTVQTSGACPNGVARVETQLSFLNQLVSLLTIGIYTPMQINATCAQ